MNKRLFFGILAMAVIVSALLFSFNTALGQGQQYGCKWWGLGWDYNGHYGTICIEEGFI